MDERFEKELDSWRHDHFHGKRDRDYSGEYLERESQLAIARRFYNLALSDLKEEIDKLRAESCPGHMDFWDTLDHFTEFIKQNESK